MAARKKTSAKAAGSKAASEGVKADVRGTVKARTGASAKGNGKRLKSVKVAADPSKSIVVRGAREHNLKNVDLVLPRDNLIVFTGLSGSGKSSLAFDTIYAEGQRRYVESLSAYARQFLEMMQKPDVDQ